jgi:hypothetical protein
MTQMAADPNLAKSSWRAEKEDMPDAAQPRGANGRRAMAACTPPMVSRLPLKAAVATSIAP